jgi:hypothetical protein
LEDKQIRMALIEERKDFRSQVHELLHRDVKPEEVIPLEEDEEFKDF